MIGILSLLTTGCGDVPTRWQACCAAAPSPISLPPPTPPTLLLHATCDPVPMAVDCRVTATANFHEWTVHLLRTDWSWSDGTRSRGYLTGYHVFPHAGRWQFGVTATDDQGQSASTDGIVTVQ